MGSPGVWASVPTCSDGRDARLTLRPPPPTGRLEIDEADAAVEACQRGRSGRAPPSAERQDRLVLGVRVPRHRVRETASTQAIRPGSFSPNGWEAMRAPRSMKR